LALTLLATDHTTVWWSVHWLLMCGLYQMYQPICQQPAFQLYIIWRGTIITFAH